MTALPWIGFAAGAVLTAGTAASVIETLVVPRSTSSRLTRWVGASVRGVFLLVTSRMRRYDLRDRVWAHGGPAVILVLLTVWLLLLLLGFALLFWPFTGPSFPEALRVSGSSMFTLGFAGVRGGLPTALLFLAAAAGLVVIALQIAYLPVLYAAFNRRETLVTMLEGLGGAPAWGPEILARHELIDNVVKLGWLYERWSEWAADVSESHSSYRALIYFRSPHPMRSWVIGLLAVLDAAALHLSLRPLTAPPEARPFIRMGYVSLRQLADALGISYDPDPHPDEAIRLTREEFDEALAHLESAGWRSERTGDEAWTHFKGWRVNYESIAHHLAEHLDAPPAMWSGPRRVRGQRQMPPRRPPHRVPVEEEREIRESTDRRRALRPPA